MRYDVAGRVVRSENAAKPASQASAYLVEYLKAQPRVRRAMDYGCGKLRYAYPLRELAHEVVFVDSRIQLSREQMVLGRRRSVGEVVCGWSSARAVAVEDLKDELLADFILCANVMSVIPDHQVRMRAVSNISGSLVEGGRALFVTQYRNSYFKAAATRPEAEAHLDGFLLKSGASASFYGILPPGALRRLVEQGGMEVVETWARQGSAYVVALNSA